MTQPQDIAFVETQLDELAQVAGRIAAIAPPDGKMDAGLRRLNRLCKGAVARVLAGSTWAEAKPGDITTLEMPVGLEAVALDLVCLPRRPTQAQARRAGAQLAKRQGAQPLLVLAGATMRISELALGLALRGYAFDTHRKTPAKRGQGARIMCTRPDLAQANAAPLMAI